MKQERLYAITVYLLNHGRTSASTLARRFEVSTRTIQRDIASLCLAGIPIIAVAGTAGGYEIAEQFRLDRHLATTDDYSRIVTALKGLLSATDDQAVKNTLEKVTHLSDPPDSGMILDFSVLREGNPDTLQMLQTAITQKCIVNFTYTNNHNEIRTHSVEPIAVLYRWYAWYLLAYSNVRKDYRIYKLVRMSNPKITDIPFTTKHEPADILLSKMDRTDTRQYTEILVKCKESVKSRVLEYLKGTILESSADGSLLIKLRVIEEEQLWIGTLLSLSDAIEIIAPERIRRRLLESASKIVALYT